MTSERQAAGGGVTPPVAGDDDYLDAVLAAYRDGHITLAEALERERVHLLVKAVPTVDKPVPDVWATTVGGMVPPP